MMSRKFACAAGASQTAPSPAASLTLSECPARWPNDARGQNAGQYLEASTWRPVLGGQYLEASTWRPVPQNLEARSGSWNLGAQSLGPGAPSRPRGRIKNVQLASRLCPLSLLGSG